MKLHIKDTNEFFMLAFCSPALDIKWWEMMLMLWWFGKQNSWDGPTIIPIKRWQRHTWLHRHYFLVEEKDLL
jgi:hypothetical protein